MDEQIEQPEKPKRGWPKGKKRGPRNPAIQTPSVAPPALPTAPAPFAPTGPTSAKYEPSREEPPEPVSVEAVTTSGERVWLSASSFLVQNGRYVFTSYPAQRGYKRVTILKADHLASLTVTAPEEMAEALKVQAQQPAPPTYLNLSGSDAGGAMAPATGPIVYGPPLKRPPYADPRQPYGPDTLATQAHQVEPTPRRPVATQISRGDDGVPEVVGAMIQPT